LIDFFTDPYKDELIYSAIARYHFYSGNLDYKDTIEECFGKRTMVPTLVLGGGIEYLANELSRDYTSQRIIDDNTIFPFYEHFIDKNRNLQVLSHMKFYGNSSAYMKLGMISGSICKKDFIYYCSICARNEINKYGDVYIHREHQLEGIILCPHHGVRIKKYKIKKADVSRIEYIRFEEKDLNLEVRNNEIEDYDKHLKLAKDAYYLLNEHNHNIWREQVFKKYKYLLYKKGLIRGNDTINQRELYEEFISYYGRNFLKFLECDIDYNNEYNWLKVITRKSKRLSHPLRHLLMINFLCSDINEFFKSIDEYKISNVDKRHEIYSLDKANLQKLSNCKRTILKINESNKFLSRTHLRKICKKEYMYIYRYDKQWLLSNLPSKVKPKSYNLRVDWEKRDMEYLESIKKRYKELISNEKLVRITRGNLAKNLGILTNLEKKIDKLPMTRRLLGEICESTEDFQLRRCIYVVNKLIKCTDEVKLWEVQRIAAIRTKEFNRIKDKVARYINEKIDLGEKYDNIFY
jgi:hypothetical protein